jgi:hypothetical protein
MDRLRGPPQDFIDACQDDALRLCHDEAMSQDNARISKCMRARKASVLSRLPRPG